MIRNWVPNNFHWCVIWGIILQCFSGFVGTSGRPLWALLGWLMLSVGTLLLLVGFACYVKAKGRNPAWALLTLAPIIGWVALLFLSAKSVPGASKMV